MHNVTPSIRHNTSTSSCISIMLLPKSLRLSTSSRLTTGCIDHQLNSATSNSTLHYRHTLRTLPSLGMDLSCYTGENTRWSIYQMNDQLGWPSSSAFMGSYTWFVWRRYNKLTFWQNQVIYYDRDKKKAHRTCSQFQSSPNHSPWPKGCKN